MMNRKTILTFIGAFFAMAFIITLTRFITGDAVHFNGKYFLACSIGSFVGAGIYVFFTHLFRTKDRTQI